PVLERDARRGAGREDGEVVGDVLARRDAAGTIRTTLGVAAPDEAARDEARLGHPADAFEDARADAPRATVRKASRRQGGHLTSAGLCCRKTEVRLRWRWRSDHMERDHRLSQPFR